MARSCHYSAMSVTMPISNPDGTGGHGGRNVFGTRQRRGVWNGFTFGRRDAGWITRVTAPLGVGQKRAVFRRLDAHGWSS